MTLLHLRVRLASLICSKDALERLHAEARLLDADAQIARDDHASPICVVEAEFDLSADLLLSSHLQSRLDVSSGCARKGAQELACRSGVSQGPPAHGRTHLGVVNECTTLGVGRQFASRRILEALDDGLERGHAREHRKSKNEGSETRRLT